MCYAPRSLSVHGSMWLSVRLVTVLRATLTASVAADSYMHQLKIIPVLPNQ